jgi:hypothetical protein
MFDLKHKPNWVGCLRVYWFYLVNLCWILYNLNLCTYQVGQEPPFKDHQYLVTATCDIRLHLTPKQGDSFFSLQYN